MTVQSSTPQKMLVNKTGESKYRLICPVCGKVSQEEIDFPDVAAMAVQGYTSVCLDCDPAADQPIPYRLAQLEGVA